MRTPQLTSVGSVSINMTPMIDVVFLLIIFFLVSSHLAKQENSFKLDLPEGKSALPDDVDRETVVVNVLPSGDWQLAGSNINASRFSSLLRKRIGTAKQPLQLRIRTDRGVKYEQVEPLFGLAASAGITDIVFSVYEIRDRNGGL